MATGAGLCGVLALTNSSGWGIPVTAIVLLLSAVALGAVRRLAVVLGDLTLACDRVAHGQSDALIPFTGRRDELGRLARSISVVKDAVQRSAALDDAVSAENERKAERQKQMT